MIESIKIKGYWWPSDGAEYHHVAHLNRIASLKWVIANWKYKKCVVQAGGSHGIWPVLLAPEFEHVYTFEPDWISFHHLVRNCQFSNVYKLQIALSDKDSPLEMIRKSYASHTIKGKGMIPAIRLDSLNLPICDAVLLDVEGYEEHALQGALNTIQEYRPLILFEDREGFAEECGRKSGGAVALMRSLKYKLVADIHADKIYIPEEKNV